MYIHISLIAILCLLFILVHVKFKCKQCNVALVYNANYEGFVLKSIFLYLHKTYAFDLFYDLSIMTNISWTCLKLGLFLYLDVLNWRLCE